MGLEILAYASFGLLLLVLVVILVTASKKRASYGFFKKRSPNLPVVPDADTFGGHLNKFLAVKRNWKKFRDFHCKYGRTFGFYYSDTPCISTVDLDFVEALILEKPNDHNNRCRLFIPLEQIEKDNILTSDVKQWSRLRMALAPAFTKTKIMMPNVQSEITTTIDKTITSIEKKLDAAQLKDLKSVITVDVDEMFFRYTNALVFSCFYKQTDVIDFDSQIDPITHVITEFVKDSLNPLIVACIIFPTLSPFISWLTLHFHPIGKMQRLIMSFIKRQTLLNLQAKQEMKEARVASKVGEKDSASSFDKDNFILKSKARFSRNLIDYVIDQFHAGKLTKSEYFNNSFFLFLAASKSSADAISKLIYNLAADQEEQDKLRALVAAEGVDCEYLHWSINESLRLFPPAPLVFRRLSYDMHTSDGLLIPAGTIVYIPANLVHRLKDYWGPDADEFKPERWRESSSFHPTQFIAFGAGKRKCLGREFAVREIKMLMTELLRRYKFKLAPDTNADTIMEMDTFIAFTSSDLPVNIEINRFV